jgi:putative hydrolase of the HAD superfamily
LFLDIGGVLLTNGWDRAARKCAAETFNLDLDEMNDRHHLTFDTYEVGKLSLDVYLNRVVFYEERPFSREDFRSFMFAQSRPFPLMIDLISSIKKQHGLRLAAVSNEGRELTVHRIKSFGLAEVIDFFVSSCFVHYRKPDEDIYRIALDMSQAKPDQVVYIDDRALFVEVAEGLGIRGIRHTGYESTKKELKAAGLSVE